VGRSVGDDDGGVVDRHHLARVQLAGLAQFDHAVDAHCTASNQVLARAAAVHEASELEQLMEFDDGVAVEGEIDAGHAVGPERGI